MNNEAAPKHIAIDINDLEFDYQNPRIRRFIEQYGTEINSEHFYLALGQGSTSQEDKNAPSFESLKQSIKTNGGIITPIMVNKQKDGRLVVVEGNTRLAIYREFNEIEGEDGNWSTIPAILYDDITEEHIDAIRLQAHLVGPRPWDPYSKAKYLDYLRNKAHFPYARLVDYCGGRQTEVERYISAYHDMEKYYRAALPDDAAFDETRFSGFVEYQRPNIKKAVFDAGFDGDDFAKWIIERNIDPLNSVRQLPRILSNEKATEVFLEDNAREALRVIEAPHTENSCAEATISELCFNLVIKINDMDFASFKKLKNGKNIEERDKILSAFDRLTELVEELSDEDF